MCAMFLYTISDPINKPMFVELISGVHSSEFHLPNAMHILSQQQPAAVIRVRENEREVCIWHVCICICMSRIYTQHLNTLRDSKEKINGMAMKTKFINTHMFGKRDSHRI